MTLKDIINRLPEEGKTVGMDVTVDQERESLDNWLDHALERLACEHIENDDPFGAGLATAAQVMVISMSLDNLDWRYIKSALEALQNYLP